MPQSKPNPERKSGSSPRSESSAREGQAHAILIELFANAGWKVRQHANTRTSPHSGMIVHRGANSYALKLKAAPDGRSDRLIPLWSQAYMEHAARATDAGSNMPQPLIVVAAPRIAPRVADKLLQFAAEYAPDTAAGVVDFVGLRRFRGAHLEDIASADAHLISPGRSTHVAGNRSQGITSSVNFSDLNQWMLKVLLAPELPQPLLSAPRSRYRNASELARAANVSAMSASRLVRQLDGEGYLDESGPYLNLVRRQDLFRRWEAAARRQVREMPMRFLLRGDPETALSRMLRDADRACLGLFAAADALHLGFVQGVPPHVYVQQLDPASAAAWRSAVRIERGEAPDFILRQALAPQSIFRGLVKVDDVPVSDVLQIWLDVSSNPSRGEEQADLIRQRILGPVIDGSHASG